MLLTLQQQHHCATVSGTPFCYTFAVIFNSKLRALPHRMQLSGDFRLFSWEDRISILQNYRLCFHGNL